MAGAALFSRLPCQKRQLFARPHLGDALAYPREFRLISGLLSWRYRIWRWICAFIFGKNGSELFVACFFPFITLFFIMLFPDFASLLLQI